MSLEHKQPEKIESNEELRAIQSKSSNDLEKIKRKAKFEISQKAFVRDGQLLYAAVIKNAKHVLYDSLQDIEKKSMPADGKTKVSQRIWTYFIHFIGWNSRWDKWVPESYLYSYTHENKLKADEIERQMKLLKGKKRKLKNPKTIEKGIKKGLREKKKQSMNDKDTFGNFDFADLQRDRKRANTQHENGIHRVQNSSFHRKSLCLNLPFTLKIILFDDEEHIMRLSNQVCEGYHSFPRTSQEAHAGYSSGRLLPILPCNLTVHDVLDKFLRNKCPPSNLPEYKAKSYPKKEYHIEKSKMTWPDFISYITALFDMALPNLLLYSPERVQYLRFHLQRKSSPLLTSIRNCQIYGCQYLLRFFTQLPFLLSHIVGSQLEQKQTENAILNIYGKCHELIRYLQKNVSTCFSITYREPNEDEFLHFEKKF